MSKRSDQDNTRAILYKHKRECVSDCEGVILDALGIGIITWLMSFKIQPWMMNIFQIDGANCTS
jgi:hypothetical protein